MRADAVMALANLVGKQVKRMPHKAIFLSSTVAPVLRVRACVCVCVCVCVCMCVCVCVCVYV
jgi:hypothetical protein